MDYLEYKTQVKYVDSLLAHSQEWQWLVDEIQEKFEIKEIARLVTKGLVTKGQAS